MFEGIFQPMHLLILLAIVLIIFGPSKLADLGKSLGQGIKGFKEAVREEPTPKAPPTDTPPSEPHK
ncbi:MAG TPA: twin-arginine translocase TatA/TatE family subunit [Terriglobales bacterium]|jgi:sec-independent protein translocase protein TatA